MKLNEFMTRDEMKKALLAGTTDSEITDAINRNNELQVMTKDEVHEVLWDSRYRNIL